MFEQDESMLRFGVTPVENLFIQEYLPAARGDYVKVYLYALYTSAHPKKELSAAEIAQELGMPQSDVEGALRYWERRHLLVRLTDNPPAYQMKSPAQLLLSGEAGMEADSAFVAFSEDIYALFGDRRKVRPSEIAQAYEWVQDLGLRQETVLMLLSHCLSTRGAQFSFKLAEPEAVRMREANVVTAEDAEAFFAHSKKVQDGARAVLRRLGKRRQPSQDEMDLYRKWTQEWRYEPDAILEACAETTKGEPTFAYLDGILNGIRARAERGEAPRSAQQLRQQMSADQEKRASVRAFAAELGLRGAPDTLNATYTRLCGEYEPGLVLLAAARTLGGRVRRGCPKETCWFVLGGAFLLALVLPALLRLLPPWITPARWSDFSYWGGLLPAVGKAIETGFSLNPCAKDVLAKWNTLGLLIAATLANAAAGKLMLSRQQKNSTNL